MLFNGNRSLPVALFSLCSLAAALPSVGWSQGPSVTAKEAMGAQLSLVFKKEFQIRTGVHQLYGDLELIKQTSLHFRKGSSRCEIKTASYNSGSVSQSSLAQATGELRRVAPGRKIETTIAQKFTDVWDTDPEDGEAGHRVTFLFGSGDQLSSDGSLRTYSPDPTFHAMVCWVKRPNGVTQSPPVTLEEVRSILGDAIEVKYAAPELREARILPAPGQSVSPASAAAI